MKGEIHSRSLAAIATLASSLVALTGPQSTAMGARGGATQSVPRIATVAIVTTKDFRVAVVARRLNGGSTPTAEVRLGLARRVGDSWREFGERRLGERYFWNTVSGPHAVCRFSIATVGTRRPSGSQVTIQLLLSPSIGCGRIYRFPLPMR